LVFMIVANSASALIYLLGSEEIRRRSPDAPAWALAVLIRLFVLQLGVHDRTIQVEEVGFLGILRFYCCRVGRESLHRPRHRHGT